MAGEEPWTASSLGSMRVLGMPRAGALAAAPVALRLYDLTMPRLNASSCDDLSLQVSFHACDFHRQRHSDAVALETTTRR